MSSLPTPHARHTARKWAEKQEDLPEGWYSLVRNYDRELRGRYFTIQLSVLADGYEKPREFMLAKIMVKDDRTVEVCVDRRPKIREMLNDPTLKVVPQVHRSTPVSAYTQVGAEIRLLRVLELGKTSLPKWYGGMRQATAQEKAEQANCWCDLENTFGEKVVVPVKVFISREAKGDFFRSLPVETHRHYMGILVLPQYGDAQLMGETVKYLSHLRNNRHC